MIITSTILPEVKLITPKVFGDERGFFFESYRLDRFCDSLPDLHFVQDNISRSRSGVLRGLHYQLRYPQGKLVTVIRGKVFDVAVDIRRGSPTFGKWVGVVLSDENHHQLYVPPGFAHGFCVLSETVDFHYKCTDYYHPEDEHGIIWDDAAIGIEWPISEAPIVSEKDAKFKNLAEIADDLLPNFR